MLPTITAFIGGVVTGYTLKLVIDRYTSKQLLTRAGMAEIVVLIVSIAWMASILVLLNNPTFQIPIAVHALMGAVVGYLFKGDNPILTLITNSNGKKNDTVHNS